MTLITAYSVFVETQLSGMMMLKAAIYLVRLLPFQMGSTRVKQFVLVFSQPIGTSPPLLATLIVLLYYLPSNLRLMEVVVPAKVLIIGLLLRGSALETVLLTKIGTESSILMILVDV